MQGIQPSRALTRLIRRGRWREGGLIGKGGLIRWDRLTGWCGLVRSQVAVVGCGDVNRAGMA